LGIRIFGLHDAEAGGFYAAKEDVEVESNALEAEHVIAVGSNFDLELGRFLLAINDGPLLIFGVFVELDAIVEAEVFKLYFGEPARESRVSPDARSCDCT
jgi:hypothetical protein